MRIRKQLYYAISILVLLKGIFYLYNIDFFTKLLSEILIFIWLLYELNKPKLKFSKALFIYLFLYLIWTFSVAISHGESLYDFYLYCRYFVLSFILMYISYNIYKIKHYANFILKSIDLFVLIQILASIFLFFTEGRLERNVGTMSSSGGALATVWPLTFAPYYFLRYVVKGRWLDVVFLVGLVFIGFASGKRGVYFLIPLSLIIIYYFF